MQSLEGLDLAQLVLATGAVGTAAFGVVEAAKVTRLRLMGFGHVRRLIERLALEGVLARAYGRTGFEALLESVFCRSGAELARTLRQGVRVGLAGSDAREIAARLGWEGARVDALVAALERVAPDESGAAAEPAGELDDRARGVIARFELALDARIQATLAAAEGAYASGSRVAAAVVAIVLAFAGGLGLGIDWRTEWGLPLIVGLAAVPLAPIAKDVAKGIKAARRAVGAAS